jgi:putative membrane protein
VEAGGQQVTVNADDDRLPEATEQRAVEIDARFLLANERTLLAWLRTGLAIIAGGVGVQQFGHVRAHRGIAVVLIVAGAAAVTAGTIRFHRADGAIRRGKLPPAGFAPTAVSAGVVVMAVVLLVAILAT